MNHKQRKLKPTSIKRRCDYCRTKLLPCISRCGDCGEKIVFRICDICKKAWGWDYNESKWVELVEVE